MEWIIKTPSAAGAADGDIIVKRFGRSEGPALDAIACVTHANKSDLWRYVSIFQGFTNVTGGVLNLQMYFDDVYIDNTLARVEIGDAATYSACSRREIQGIPPSG